MKVLTGTQEQITQRLDELEGKIKRDKGGIIAIQEIFHDDSELITLIYVPLEGNELEEAEKRLEKTTKKDLQKLVIEFGGELKAKQVKLYSTPKTKQQLIESFLGQDATNGKDTIRSYYEKKTVAELKIMATYRNVATTFKRYVDRTVELPKAEYVYFLLYETQYPFQIRA